MKNSLATCCFAVFATAMALPGQAAVINQPVFSFGPSALNAAMPDPTFNQFNSSLGTLNSVTITLAATITGSTTIERTCFNLSLPFTCTGNVTPTGGTTRTVTLDLPNATTADLTLSNTDTWNTIFNLDLNFAQQQTETESVNAQSSQFVTDVTVLAAYTGLGTITFGLGGVVSHNLVASGGGSFWGISTPSGSASGTVTVVYDYTPVTAVAAPEPTALGLLGIGLMGLGALARRRRWTA